MTLPLRESVQAIVPVRLQPWRNAVHHADQKRWERSHKNGRIANVTWKRASNQYVASASDPRQRVSDTKPVRTGLLNERDAKSAADRLAHDNCDGSCQPWQAA